MKRKEVFILVACMVFGVGVLYSLYALSPFAADIRPQPFERNFDSRIQIHKLSEIDLKVNSFYLAGTAKNTVYLGNFTGPLHLVQVDLPKLDTVHMNTSIEGIKMPNDYQLFRMKVDSPYFYLSHNVLPGIFKGRLDTLKAKSFISGGSPYFADAIPISPTRFALKSLMHDTQENELATLTLDSPYFEFKPKILEKQIDGIFCVDGMLNFSKPQNKLVYVYAYRNEYIVTDTTLTSINRFHTIDTFSRANVKIAAVKSKNYSTLASPPSRINVKSWVHGNLLFVQSPFLAANEDKFEFQAGCPIDVYDFKQGKYLYSFHLGAVHGYLPSSVAVVKDYLMAIYNQYLVLYKLELPKQDLVFTPNQQNPVL